jgi:hypothetical protein
MSTSTSTHILYLGAQPDDAAPLWRRFWYIKSSNSTPERL